MSGPRTRTGTDRLKDFDCKAKPGAKRQKRSDGKGLYLLVEPNGSKLWRVKYRYGGKERTYAIGGYPEVSLAEARAERDRARAWLREGKDPTVERKANRVAAADHQADTFGSMAEEWFATQSPNWSESHRTAQRRRLDNELLPTLDNVPLRDLKPMGALEVLRGIEARGAHETTSKSRILGSQVYRFAVQTGRAEVDPFALLRGALVRPPAKNRATIPASEMPELFKALAAVPAERVTKLAVYWTILTSCRSHEMRFAPWSEIDGSTWCIPAARMKMRNPHMVPLPRQAQRILTLAKPLRTSEEPNALIFPGFTRNGSLSENAVLALLARAGFYGRQTGHGFRASFSTWAHEVAEADPDVIEACLAHVRGDVRAIYNRSLYLPQRKVLLQQWADQCTAWGMKLP